MGPFTADIQRPLLAAAVAAGEMAPHQTSAQADKTQPVGPCSSYPGQTHPRGPGSTHPGQAQPRGPGSTHPGQAQPRGPGSTHPGQTQSAGPCSTHPVQVQPTVPCPSDPAQTQPTGLCFSHPGQTQPAGPCSSHPGQTQPAGPCSSHRGQTQPAVPSCSHPGQNPSPHSAVSTMTTSPQLPTISTTGQTTAEDHHHTQALLPHHDTYKRRLPSHSPSAKKPRWSNPSSSPRAFTDGSVSIQLCSSELRSPSSRLAAVGCSSPDSSCAGKKGSVSTSAASTSPKEGRDSQPVVIDGGTISSPKDKPEVEVTTLQPTQKNLRKQSPQ